MPAHHPDADLLLEYVTGACGEPAGVVIASHVSLCSVCAAACNDLEQLGGAMLEEVPVARMSDGALERALDALDAPAPAPRTLPAPDAMFPAPLRDYLGFASHRTRWKPVVRGLSTYRADSRGGSQALRLMRIAAGTSMPAHRHGGRELTLVLDGGFSDESGHYVRGDLANMDASDEHAPCADAGADCVCLALNDGGIRLSGLLGRFLSPFVRF